MKVKSESEVAQSCPTLSDPMDCSPPGSPIHGIFQARVLEWGAIAFSVGFVTEHKFMCPTQEVKQNGTSVGSRERFIAGPCKETGGCCPQVQTPQRVSGKPF